MTEAAIKMSCPARANVLYFRHFWCIVVAIIVSYASSKLEIDIEENFSPTSLPTLCSDSAGDLLYVSDQSTINREVSPGDAFGVSVAFIGDVDQDGINDVAIGSDESKNGGSVYIGFMFANISLKSYERIDAALDIIGYQNIAADDRFGSAVSFLGDLNGDGINDIAVGAPGDDDGSVDAGAVYILFLSRIGAVIGAQKISALEGNFGLFLNSQARFGSAVSTLGDISGDGVQDIAIGAPAVGDPNLYDPGSVYILFLQPDGTVRSTTTISYYSGNGFYWFLDASEKFGCSVAGLGDVNGDGIGDLAIGAKNDDDGASNAGAVYILLLNSLGQANSAQRLSMVYGLLKSHVSLGQDDQFGSSIAPLGDLDGDGVPDLIVGAPGDADAGPDSGAFYIILLQPNSFVKDAKKLSAFSAKDLVDVSTNRLSGGVFGYSVASLGYANGEPSGNFNLLIGNPSATINGVGSGSYFAVGLEACGSYDVPTLSPTASSAPTMGPSVLPSSRPTALPSAQPAMWPSSQPSAVPSTAPSLQPWADPTAQPVLHPTSPPSSQPSSWPSSMPSRIPTSCPSTQPSKLPSNIPTAAPSHPPSSFPSDQPSGMPSHQPSSSPSIYPTQSPSSQPTQLPTDQPSGMPSHQPSSSPSIYPTQSPSSQPSQLPTDQPSALPTHSPTCSPSCSPTQQPTFQPSCSPSSIPSTQPTMQPTSAPSAVPSSQPSAAPSSLPSDSPTRSPSLIPSIQPISIPSNQPTCHPSNMPSTQPSGHPSGAPSLRPTACPSLAPTMQPSQPPSTQPSMQPSAQPSAYPSGFPSMQPSASPSASPTAQPSCCPSLPPSNSPTGYPSEQPSSEPSAYPSAQPSHTPTMLPSSQPTDLPSAQPSSHPSGAPTTQPSTQPTSQPSAYPSALPSTQPSAAPSALPSFQPSAAPSSMHTAKPSTDLSILPVALTQVAVTVSAPDFVGLCSDLLIDASASSGSGGVAWTSASISVSTNSEVVDISPLRALLSSSEYSLFPPTAIPRDLLVSDTLYRFTITLCSVYGLCGEASKAVTVTDDVIPFVVIDGAAARTIKRKEALKLYASASIDKCGQAAAAVPLSGGGAAISYVWTISPENDAVSGDSTMDLNNGELFSVSSDPSMFLLPSYSLSAGRSYRVICNVGSPSYSNTSSIATVIVSVQEGSVVARILGGTSRGARRNETAVLDASLSFDEDAKLGEGGAAAAESLVFNWSCSLQHPETILISCEQAFALSTPLGVLGSSATLGLRPRTSAPLGLLARFVVSVSRANDSQGSGQQADFHASGAVSIASVLITILSEVSPLIGLYLPNQNRMVNAVEELRVVASVEVESHTTFVSGVWSVDVESSPLNLSVAALSAWKQSVSLFPQPAAGQQAYLSLGDSYLVLGSNSISPGAELTFKYVVSAMLEADGMTDIVASATIVVQINSAPSPGVFLVSPVDGAAFESEFAFTAAFWQDEHLPLTYQFGFKSAGDILISLRSQRESPTHSTLLPAGPDSNAYALECFVEVFDSLAASSVVIQTVRVAFSVSHSATNLTDLADRHLVRGNESSIDEIKLSTALVSSVLNIVSCSGAPNCTEINRNACSRTKDTCGECISATFVGADGDSNNPCIDIIKFSHKGFNGTDRSCQNTVDCAGFAVCESGFCVVPEKACAGNCSGNGRCALQASDTGSEVSSCLIGDPSCDAVCECDADYALSSSCSLTNEKMVVKQDLRARLIDLIADLTFRENTNTAALLAWASILVEGSQQTDELNPYSQERVLNTTDDLLLRASTEGFQSSQFEPFLLAINSATRAGLNMRISTSLPVTAVSPISADSDAMLTAPADSLYTAVSATVPVKAKTLQLSGSSDVAGEFPSTYHSPLFSVAAATAASTEPRAAPSAVNLTATSLRASQSLRRYGEALSGTLSPGQQPVVTTQSEVRLFSTVLSTPAFLVDDMDNSNTTLRLPQTSLEALVGTMQPASLTLQISKEDGHSDSGTVYATVFSLRAALYGAPVGSLRSNPIYLQLSDGFCVPPLPSNGTTTSPTIDSSPCSVLIRVPLSVELRGEPVASLEQSILLEEAGFLECGNGELLASEYTCSDGTALQLACTGEEGTVRMMCPRIVDTAVCNSIFGKRVENAGCSVVSSNEVETICRCPIAIAADSTAEFASDSSATEQSSRTKYSVNTVAMLQSTTETFVATFESAGGVDGATVEKSRQVVGVIGGLIILVLLMMWSANFADEEMRQRKVKQDMIIEKHVDDRLVRMIAGMHQRVFSVMSSCRISRSTAVLPSSLQAASRTSRLREHSSGRSRRNNTVPLLKEVRIIERSLPHILSSRSFADRFLLELKRHHRWLSVVYYYSTVLPRIYRVASLATNVIIIMFFESIFYDMVNPDERACTRHDTVDACRSEISAAANGASICQWDSQAPACRFVQPDNNLQVMVSVAVFSALLSIPIASFTNYIIVYVLAAPTVTDEVHQQNIGHAASTQTGPTEILLSEEAKTCSERELANELSARPMDGSFKNTKLAGGFSTRSRRGSATSYRVSAAPAGIDDRIKEEEEEDPAEPVLQAQSLRFKTRPMIPSLKLKPSTFSGGSQVSPGHQSNFDIEAALSATSPRFALSPRAQPLSPSSPSTPSMRVRKISKLVSMRSFRSMKLLSFGKASNPLTELVELSGEIRAHRLTLSLEERKTFDDLWGLDATGSLLAVAGLTSPSRRVGMMLSPRGQSSHKTPYGAVSSAHAKHVLAELAAAKDSEEYEVQVFKTENMSEHEIGKRLLFLFQRDLLPGPQGRILDAKAQRDVDERKHVSLRTKAAGWIALAVVNAAMLVYVMLFAFSQNNRRQTAWLRSFLLWLFVDITVVSTNIVLVVHILLPSVILVDLHQIKERLIETIRRHNIEIVTTRRMSERRIAAAAAAAAANTHSVVLSPNRRRRPRRERPDTAGSKPSTPLASCRSSPSPCSLGTNFLLPHKPLSPTFSRSRPLANANAKVFTFDLPLDSGKGSVLTVPAGGESSQRAIFSDIDTSCGNFGMPSTPTSSRVAVLPMSTSQTPRYWGGELLQETAKPQQAPFNASKYFFVSARVAKHYPDLNESQIISRYRTTLPKTSFSRALISEEFVGKSVSSRPGTAGAVRASGMDRPSLLFLRLCCTDSRLKEDDKAIQSDVGDSRSYFSRETLHTGLIVMVMQLVNIPQSAFDAMIEAGSTLLMGYFILLHILLYKISPVLAVIPVIVVGVVVHFVIVSGSAAARRTAAELNSLHRQSVAEPEAPASNQTHSVVLEQFPGETFGLGFGDQHACEDEESLAPLPIQRENSPFVEPIILVPVETVRNTATPILCSSLTVAEGEAEGQMPDRSAEIPKLDIETDVAPAAELPSPHKLGSKSVQRVSFSEPAMDRSTSSMEGTSLKSASECILGFESSNRLNNKPPVVPVGRSQSEGGDDNSSQKHQSSRMTDRLEAQGQFDPCDQECEGFVGGRIVAHIDVSSVGSTEEVVEDRGSTSPINSFGVAENESKERIDRDKTSQIAVLAVSIDSANEVQEEANCLDLKSEEQAQETPDIKTFASKDDHNFTVNSMDLQPEHGEGVSVHELSELREKQQAALEQEAVELERHGFLAAKRAVLSVRLGAQEEVEQPSDASSPPSSSAGNRWAESKTSKTAIDSDNSCGQRVDFSSEKSTCSMVLDRKSAGFRVAEKKPTSYESKLESRQQKNEFGRTIAESNRVSDAECSSISNGLPAHASEAKDYSRHQIDAKSELHPESLIPSVQSSSTNHDSHSCPDFVSEVQSSATAEIPGRDTRNISEKEETQLQQQAAERGDDSEEQHTWAFHEALTAPAAARIVRSMVSTQRVAAVQSLKPLTILPDHRTCPQQPPREVEAGAGEGSDLLGPVLSTVVEKYESEAPGKSENNITHSGDAFSSAEGVDQPDTPRDSSKYASTTNQPDKSLRRDKELNSSSVNSELCSERLGRKSADAQSSVGDYQVGEKRTNDPYISFDQSTEISVRSIGQNGKDSAEKEESDGAEETWAFREALTAPAAARIVRSMVATYAQRHPMLGRRMSDDDEIVIASESFPARHREASRAPAPGSRFDSQESAKERDDSGRGVIFTEGRSGDRAVEDLCAESLSLSFRGPSSFD